MTHPTWELDVLSNGAALVLTPCPGTKGLGLVESLTQLKQQGVKALVTAISHQEMAEKEVSELGEQAQELGLEWHHIVIEDDQAPSERFAKQWAAASPRLHQALNNGDKVALHCMGGSGRTGLLAAHLLLEMDWDLDKVIQEVQALRPGAFTKPVQLEYIKGIANQDSTGQ